MACSRTKCSMGLAAKASACCVQRRDATLVVLRFVQTFGRSYPLLLQCASFVYVDGEALRKMKCVECV
jgi:hypothetical protein